LRDLRYIIIFMAAPFELKPPKLAEVDQFLTENGSALSDALLATTTTTKPTIMIAGSTLILTGKAHKDSDPASWTVVLQPKVVAFIKTGIDPERTSVHSTTGNVASSPGPSGNRGACCISQNIPSSDPKEYGESGEMKYTIPAGVKKLRVDRKIAY
jgi:hypothetical protein